MRICRRCRLAFAASEPFVCPRCFELNGGVGVRGLPTIQSVAEAIATLDAVDPLARTFARWAIRSLGQGAIDALVAEHDRAPRAATRGALLFLGRTIDAGEDPEAPVPYLGEAVIFREEDDELGDDFALWLAIVEREQVVYGSDLDEEHVGGAWQPDRVVLARSEVVLSFHDFWAEAEVRRPLHAAGEAFPMGELLRGVHRAYIEHANPEGERIFEGLTRIGPGVYRLNTGS